MFQTWRYFSLDGVFSYIRYLVLTCLTRYVGNGCVSDNILGKVNNELGGCINTGWGYGEDQCTCTTTYKIWKMGKLTFF